MAGGLAFQRSPMGWAGGRFRTQEIGRANLHPGCAEGHCRRNPFGLGNPPRCNHRKPDRLHNLRQQGEGTHLGSYIFRHEHAPVPARLKTLSNNGVNALGFEPAGFFNGRGRREYFSAPAFHPRQ